MGSSGIISAEKWICAYLSNYETLDVVEEYLLGVAEGSLSMNCLPGVDYGGKNGPNYEPNLT